MTGLDLILTACCGAAALLLLSAGVGHVRHRRLFAATLAAQRLLPHGVQPLVAAVMGPLEIVLGVGLLAGIVAGGDLSRVTSLAAGLLYLAFGAYVAVVWRTRPRVPCGCFGSQAPASGSTVLRAVVLGVAALAVAAVGIPGAARTGAADAVVVAGAALVLTGAFWLLPEIAGHE